MRKGLLIVGIVIAALLVLLLCVYWIFADYGGERSTPMCVWRESASQQADYTYNIFDDVLYNAKEREIYYSEYGFGRADRRRRL